MNEDTQRPLGQRFTQPEQPKTPEALSREAYEAEMTPDYAPPFWQDPTGYIVSGAGNAAAAAQNFMSGLGRDWREFWSKREHAEAAAATGLSMDQVNRAREVIDNWRNRNWAQNVYTSENATIQNALSIVKRFEEAYDTIMASKGNPSALSRQQERGALRAASDESTQRDARNRLLSQYIPEGQATIADVADYGEEANRLATAASQRYSSDPNRESARENMNRARAALQRMYDSGEAINDRAISEWARTFSLQQEDALAIIDSPEMQEYFDNRTKSIERQYRDADIENFQQFLVDNAFRTRTRQIDNPAYREWREAQPRSRTPEHDAWRAAEPPKRIDDVDSEGRPVLEADTSDKWLAALVNYANYMRGDDARVQTEKQRALEAYRAQRAAERSGRFQSAVAKQEAENQERLAAERERRAQLDAILGTAFQQAERSEQEVRENANEAQSAIPDTYEREADYDMQTSQQAMNAVTGIYDRAAAERFAQITRENDWNFNEYASAIQRPREFMDNLVSLGASRTAIDRWFANPSNNANKRSAILGLMTQRGLDVNSFTSEAAINRAIDNFERSLSAAQKRQLEEMIR